MRPVQRPLLSEIDDRARRLEWTGSQCSYRNCYHRRLLFPFPFSHALLNTFKHIQTHTGNSRGTLHETDYLEKLTLHHSPNHSPQLYPSPVYHFTYIDLSGFLHVGKRLYIMTTSESILLMLPADTSGLNVQSHDLFCTSHFQRTSVVRSLRHTSTYFLNQVSFPQSPSCNRLSSPEN